jgi:transposase
MAVATVIIGVDPHKGSHTAVAVGGDEMPLGQVRVRVRARDGQAGQLLDWARAWPERAWAVEGARGMGHLLARQLVTAGERALDVQPKLGARVRLLAAGDVNKNDPNDARAVAVAALRSPGAEVRADDHAAVLKVWPERHRDLGRLRTQAACRLHAVLRADPRRRLPAHHRRPGRADSRAARTVGRGGRRPHRARRGPCRGPAPYR